MFRVAVVDDDPFYIDDFKTHISHYQKENNMTIEVVTFSDGLKFISEYQPIYDILFLDIDMPFMNGMEVAKVVRKSDPNAIIIFITNMAQYAVKGYEVNAFDYVMKPIEYFSFSVKLKGAIAAVENTKEFIITIPWEDGSRNLKTSDLLFVEVRDHWLYFHTKEGEYRIFGTLNEVEKQLKEHHFVRSNNCYLINLKHVIHLRAYTVTLQGDYKLKISRARRKEVQFAFIDYYSEHRG